MSGEYKTAEPEEQVTYSSSSYSTKAIKFNAREINEKLLLVRRITQACQEIVRKPIQDLQQTLEDKIHFFTGLPVEQIEPVLSNIGTRDRSYLNFYKNLIEFSDQSTETLCESIRSIFVNYYVKLRKIPTTSLLLKDLKDNSEHEAEKMYVDEDITIQKLIKNKLLKYHHIPQYKRYLLMEHPELVYNRTLYLKTVQECRLQERNIVYVDLRRLDSIGSTSFYVGLALMPNKNILEKFLAKDLSDVGPIKWLKGRVIPNITPDSVVVFFEADKNTEKLTPHSKKEDILTWLRKHNISYGKNPHTAEAYALYKAHEKKVDQEGPFDHVFAEAGLDLIKCSKKWNSVNCFHRFWEQIYRRYKMISIKKKLGIDVLKDMIIKATYWLSQNIEVVERNLIAAENTMITEDAEMEMILDNLMEMIDNGEINIGDFPDDSYADKMDNYEMHISDIFTSINYNK